MRRVDLEILVQQQVGRVRAGRPVEDDRVELKRQWPDPDKCARQLAGAANALRGEALVYVIGCDEKTGTTTPLDGTDPADWYRAVAKRFDSDAPRLVSHVNVGIGDNPSDTVVALYFETDAFPYVMGIEGKTDRREVPLRVGSGTASANRQQLLSLLAPTLRAPQCEVVGVQGSLTLNRYEGISRLDGSSAEPRTELRATAWVDVLIAHAGPTPVSFLGQNVRMTTEFMGSDLAFESNAQSDVKGTRPDSPSGDAQIAMTGGVAVVRGPGIVTFRATTSVTRPQTDEEDLVSRAAQAGRAGSVRVHLELPFISTPGVTRLSGIAFPTFDPTIAGDFSGPARRTWQSLRSAGPFGA